MNYGFCRRVVRGLELRGMDDGGPPGFFGSLDLPVEGEISRIEGIRSPVE